jgi:hypothetical protein
MTPRPLFRSMEQGLSDSARTNLLVDNQSTNLGETI